ncbi:MAG: hypothetical protein ACR2LE_03060, partial [Nocardioidaceae bacterium]
RTRACRGGCPSPSSAPDETATAGSQDWYLEPVRRPWEQFVSVLILIAGLALFVVLVVVAVIVLVLWLVRRTPSTSPGGRPTPPGRQP